MKRLLMAASFCLAFFAAKADDRGHYYGHHQHGEGKGYGHDNHRHGSNSGHH